MRGVRFLPVVLFVALVAAPAAQASRSDVEVVASGLDSPRHLAFGSHGDLFVAEAGRGGDGPCFTAGEGPACMGASGAVTKVDRRGRQSRIAEGLASMANTPGDLNAIGPHGIAVFGRDHVLITNGGPTEPRESPVPPEDAPGPTISREALAAQNPVADLFGRLLALGRHGAPLRIADIWAFERDINPDGPGGGNPRIDSNPVDVLLDGRRLVVADAGGNALDVVSPRGRVSNLAVFPNRFVPNPFGGPDIPMQAVPTAVALGPDHKYYVGQLTGFPFPLEGAKIFRVDPRTGATTEVAHGFTNIMDLEFGRDGTLYVLEIAHDGLFSPLERGRDLRDLAPRRAASGRAARGHAPMPGGIAVHDGGLYVSINSGSPGGGHVIRLSRH